MKCFILLESDDMIEVDISSGLYEWKYVQFPCEFCKYQFHTRNGLFKHKKKKHNINSAEVEEVPFTTKTVSIDDIVFFESENIPTTSESQKKEVRQKKLRFKEICDEMKRNEKWRDSLNNDDKILYNEIKESERNFNRCKEAKENELINFDKYQVYEEVEENDKEVLGTRFVLTEKPDGTIKARFVVKGFQEEIIQSDSPTASRETLKVFCTITANEKWDVVASDVRAAFLQSDK